MAPPIHRYIPWSEESEDIKACGIPINYNASKEWADKKVVLFALPGTSPPAEVRSLTMRPRY
jgi:alkyl hydroperoxide reductase 1